MFNEILQICHLCYKAKTVFIPSENKVIDDFIKYTLINNEKARRMEFVFYDKFKNVEFIAEGGFSKVTWTDGPTTGWNGKQQKYIILKTSHIKFTKLNKDLPISPQLLFWTNMAAYVPEINMAAF
ncbi:hypothetical protein C1645_818741 [Glomus cerebriforme]|uniref:Uncharacterized protein n=1 Tax=Glomus cerebriforme TaxID=658196 RepID=A0A397TAK9_9GLOM|nr:hypothetical protein C1645_818741 [Glomus cerebriforme]